MSPNVRKSPRRSVPWTLLWTLLLVFGAGPTPQVSGLRITMDVPPVAEAGTNVTMVCEHDPEGQELYTLKWYKQRTQTDTRGREFVRYTPKEIPSVKLFGLHGVTVDKDRTNGTHVVLINVSPKTTGKYSCEVSMDSPEFQTDTATAEMEIVVLPSSEPVVTGLKTYYAIGEPLQANCTLNGSIPAPQMDWKLNSMPVIPSAVIKYEAIKDAGSKLLVRTIGLHIGQLGHEHFVKGKLVIKCSGHIHSIYKGVKEVVVDEDRPQVFSPSLSYLSDEVHVMRNTTAPAGQGMGISVGVRYLDQTSQNVINDNTQAASARNWSSPRTESANWLQLLALVVACLLVAQRHRRSPPPSPPSPPPSPQLLANSGRAAVRIAAAAEEAAAATAAEASSSLTSVLLLLEPLATLVSRLPATGLSHSSCSHSCPTQSPTSSSWSASCCCSAASASTSTSAPFADAALNSAL